MLQFFWRRLRRDEGGFTLIELLIVVAIIAILAAILIPNFLRARKQSQISATKGNLKNIGTALESYFVDKGGYPPTDNDLTPLVTDGYIRATPFRPGGAAYAYDASALVGGLSPNYILCDNSTDTLGGFTFNGVTIPTGNATWYYSPAGGLGAVAGTTCPAAP